MTDATPISSLNRARLHQEQSEGDEHHQRAPVSHQRLLVQLSIDMA